MKILHTGDLHLGKTLHETSLLEDQKIMLDLLLEELSRDSYAALIIAGAADPDESCFLIILG